MVIALIKWGESKMTITIKPYTHLTKEDIDFILDISIRELNHILEEAENPTTDLSNSKLSALRAGAPVQEVREETDKLVHSVIKAVDGGSIYCNHDFTGRVCNHCDGEVTNITISKDEGDL